MVLELADIHIQAGKQSEFDIIIQRGIEHVIKPSKGFLTFKVHKGIESPERYILSISWHTLEDHMNFRASSAFTEWRQLVTPFFATTPIVEHFTLLTESNASAPL